MAKTVLITGANSGLGYEFAKLFAKDGYELVLTGRNEKTLSDCTEELRKNYGVKVYSIIKDLSLPGAAKEIYTELVNKKIDIDILLNNAGTEVYGTFYETSLEKELALINVNLVSLTELTKLFLVDMKKKNSGKILNIGSTGSFVPGANNAVYCATKAYVLSFSEAVAEELSNTNIKVVTLCPGPTKTNFAKNAGMENTFIFKMYAMSAEKVAKIGFNALKKGKRVEIAGFFNRFQIFLIRFFPRIVVTKIVKLQMGRIGK